VGSYDLDFFLNDENMCSYFAPTLQRIFGKLRFCEKTFLRI
jgi:hypothetical protein